MINIIAMKKGKNAYSNPFVSIWRTNVIANGGFLGPSTISTLQTLTTQLIPKSYFSKIVYFLPLCGVGINAAVVPLIDTLSKGICTNVNFTDGDFSESTGLTGDGSSKLFTLPLYYSDVATAYGSAGMLFSDRNYTNSYPGAQFLSYCSGGVFGGFILRNDGRAFFSTHFTGDTSASAIYDANTGSAGMYYAQDNSRTLSYYINGSVQSLSTTSESSQAGQTEYYIGLCGAPSTSWYSSDTIGCAMITNGSLTSVEISDLYSTINTYLIVATGR